MKKFYLLSLILTATVFLFAKDVSKAEAEKVGRNFYHLNTGITVESVSTASEVYTENNVGRTSDGKPVYYVFNINNSQGFVIVSGDDLVQPVLGYSTEGPFNPATISASTDKWMDNYEKQIIYVKENLSETTPDITRQWVAYLNGYLPEGSERGTNAVNPLCQAKWNQAPYENGLCPFDNQYNQRAVTGCVATAMAIIMKFWSYPTQGTGFHSYNDQKYGTQSANFGSATYNWAQMPNVLSSANNDVATIMYHCGVSVDMNYGVAATGGSAAYVVSALSPIQACSEYSYKTYFGYDPSTVQGVVRQNYSDANWVALLKNELDNSRPLQYAGIGSGGGHTWVCDGYDNNNFFHMNWGWGGNSDGYFSLNSLDPTSLGAGGGTGGFNNNQQAVIGIKPLNGGGGGGGGGGGTVNQDGIQLYAATTVSANPVTAGSSFTVNATIANAGSTSFTGDFAAAIFNSNGVFVDFIQEFTNQTAQAGYYYNVPFTTNSLDLVPGTYIIGLFYKNGSNNYSLINPSTYANPVSVTVTGNYSDIQMYNNSSVSPSTPVQNQSFTVNTQIANAGGTNFSGWLSADLFDMEGNYVTTIEELSNISMQAGYYYNVQFVTNGLNVDPGTYYIAFFSSTNQQNWSLVYGQQYPNPIQVTITGQPLSPDQYENNNTSNGAYAFTANFSGNTANISTTGSNIHVGNDYDYYKINLPSGTNYSITARVHDSYNSGNGNNYTNDVQFSYVVNGGSQSSTYDDVMPGAVFVQNGGTVIFFVSDYFSGTTGTYLLDLQITRGQNVGIAGNMLNDVKIFPNPAHDYVWIDGGDLQGNFELEVFDQTGRNVLSNNGLASGLIKTDVSAFSAGVYMLKLKNGNTLSTGKIIKAE